MLDKRFKLEKLATNKDLGIVKPASCRTKQLCDQNCKYLHCL